MLLAYDEKDVAAKTHYENKYFSIDVPEDWIGYWDVIEEEIHYMLTRYCIG